MKQLISILASRLATEKMVGEYYHNFFSYFQPTTLFEIYDIDAERFVKFPGREGSQVVNRDTLIKNLTEMEANHAPVENLLVIKYDEDDIDFNDPVFIGKVDSFYAQNKEC